MTVPWPVAMRAERLVLELRELLVRFDENLKADTLMQECVPYFLEDRTRRGIVDARREQAMMVKHITGEGPYRDYYASNVHERPFEEQYGIEASEAHLHLHRVAFLDAWLSETAEPHRTPVLLDLACNDGWMAANLKDRHNLAYHGIDLNPDNVARARRREMPSGHAFWAAQAEDALAATGLDGYDAVIAFELVEHVRDPDELLAAMVSACKPGGALFISTPWGACEQGDLPTWWHVEPKGHVRVYTPESLCALISRHGAVVDDLQVSEQGRARLMVCRATVPDSRRDAAQPVRADRAGGPGDPGAPGRPGAAER